MKKIISVFLAIAIIFTTCCIAVNAEKDIKEKDITDYPLIIVAGYSSSALVDEDGNQVWHLNFDHVLDAVIDNIAELGVGLGALTVKNAEIITDTLAREMRVFLEKLSCNPDGTSKYNLSRAKVTAEETNSKVLKELYPDGQYRHEQDMAVDFAEYVGDENIFNFTCDFRMGAEYCAKQLDELIQDVKKYTNKNKVNLFAVSHGGQVTATYLTLYGEKNDVDNALMTVPAIGGAGIAYDALTSNVDFDEECLLRFIQHGMRLEEDYDWLMKAGKLGFIDDIFNALIPKIFDIVGYWGSLWDFMSTDKYEDAKKQLLNKEESAKLIETSDRFHYEILPQMRTKLKECQERGMNISIIAGTGNPILTGVKEYSDGIITTADSTGATVAPLGKRFGNGYVQKKDCGGKNKVSPDMTIDASDAYLPDNTWFVNGLFHGMTYWDTYSRSLLMTLLFTDNITDVYSDENYPQFKDTSNPSSAVISQFKDCKHGEISSSTKSIVITNCCWENDLKLSAILCDGAEISFKINPHEKLSPGESVEIEFTGEIPKESKASVNLTIYYTMNTITPIGYRTQYFTTIDGEKAEYSDEYDSFSPTTPFDDFTGELLNKILIQLGLRDLIKMYFNIAYYWINLIA